MEKIEKVTIYDRQGNKHLFEVYRKPSGVQYIVLLDGAFSADGNSRHEIDEEVENTIKWFGWQVVNTNKV